MSLPNFVPETSLLIPFIRLALAEDIGDGDHTSLSTIPEDTQGKAVLKIKDNGIIAGIELSRIIFQEVDPFLKFSPFKSDGEFVRYGDEGFIVEGSVHSILKAERVVLNCMQRMSGIATLTYTVVMSLQSTQTKVLDTRKTTPGFRYLEKWAVYLGGGVNHRFGLYDMILIKDNHIDFAGGISQALNRVKEYLGQNHKSLKVEIEVRNLSELDQVLKIGGVDRILLDNFSLPNLKIAVSKVGGRYPTEASGGITPENALEFAKTGVNYLSMGALTHSHTNFDLSLKAL